MPAQILGMEDAAVRNTGPNTWSPGIDYLLWGERERLDKIKAENCWVSGIVKGGEIKEGSKVDRECWGWGSIFLGGCPRA